MTGRPWITAAKVEVRGTEVEILVNEEDYNGHERWQPLVILSAREALELGRQLIRAAWEAMKK